MGEPTQCKYTFQERRRSQNQKQNSQKPSDIQRERFSNISPDHSKKAHAEQQSATTNVQHITVLHRHQQQQPSPHPSDDHSADDMDVEVPDIENLLRIDGYLKPNEHEIRRR